MSFLVAFLALIVYPINAFVADEGSTIRLASGTIAAVYVIEIVLARHDRLNWPGRRWLVGALLPDGVFAVINAANIWLGLTGLLEVGLLLRLVHPVNLFLLVLRSFEPRVREE